MNAVKVTAPVSRVVGRVVGIEMFEPPEDAVTTDEEVYVVGHDKFAVDQYRDARRVAYPEIGDQLDAMHKALTALMHGAPVPDDALAVLARISDVKTAYPKPE